MNKPLSDGDLPSFHDVFQRARGERSPAILSAARRLALMAVAPQQSRRPFAA